MPWSYLLLFDDEAGSLDCVRRFIDTHPDILNWYHILPNSFFIVSERTADQLANIFRRFTNDKGRFIILDTKSDRSGWLPLKAWQFMADPKPSGRSR
jgi:hypothetical protein